MLYINPHQATELKSATESYEEKEKKLVEDCIAQIGSLNQQVEGMAEELHQKATENVHQKDEIHGFLSQVTDLQLKIRKVS